MRLLIFPEYDASTPHVVVDSVFMRLLPELGHTVHVVRAARGIDRVEEHAASNGPDRLILFPAEQQASRLQYFGRVRRRRLYVDQALDALSGEAYDAVVVRNDFVDGAAALRFAAARRVPFVYQYTSPEPEFRIKGPGNAIDARRAYHIARGCMDIVLRRRLSRRADAVLAISAMMRRHLIAFDRLDADRVFAFPMGIGSNPEPSTADIERARAQLDLPWRRTMVYSGVIDVLRQPEFMLDVLDVVLQQVPDAGLLVLTYQQDERRRAFEAAAAARALPVKVVGPLHHSTVSAFARCGDVMLCPVPPRIEFAMMSPTKSLEALGAGMPVVGSREVEEHERLLVEGGGGLAVPFDVTSFAEGVVSLLQDPGRRERMGRAGQQFVQKFRTYMHLARYLESILLALVERRPLAAMPHDPDAVACEPVRELVTD